MRIAAMVRVALTSAQQLFRYQSLRMDLPKSTGRLFAILSLTVPVLRDKGPRVASSEMEPSAFSGSISAQGTRL
jgi:hypothetical protein